MDEPLLFTRVYETVRYLLEIAPRLPKVYRPTLTSRLLDAGLDLLGAVTDLRFTRERAPLFARADGCLDRLRVLSRLMADLHVLSLAQYERVAREVDEAGRLLGGWRKAT